MRQGINGRRLEMACKNVNIEDMTDYRGKQDGSEARRYALDVRDCLVSRLAGELASSDKPLYEDVGEDDGHIWARRDGITVDVFINDYANESGFVPPAEWNLMANDSTQRSEQASSSHDTTMQWDSHGITEGMTADQAAGVLEADVELMFGFMELQRVEKPWLFD